MFMDLRKWQSHQYFLRKSHLYKQAPTIKQVRWNFLRILIFRRDKNLWELFLFWYVIKMVKRTLWTYFFSPFVSQGIDFLEVNWMIVHEQTHHGAIWKKCIFHALLTNFLATKDNAVLIIFFSRFFLLAYFWSTRSNLYR